jgi:hypothetical protein
LPLSSDLVEKRQEVRIARKIWPAVSELSYVASLDLGIPQPWLTWIFNLALGKLSFDRGYGDTLLAIYHYKAPFDK